MSDLRKAIAWQDEQEDNDKYSEHRKQVAERQIELKRLLKVVDKIKLSEFTVEDFNFIQDLKRHHGDYYSYCSTDHTLEKLKTILRIVGNKWI